MKQFLIILILALLNNVVSAQSLFQKKADQLYNELSYIAAIDYYKSLVKKDAPTEANMRKLAECYFKVYDFVNAEEAYKSLNSKFTANVTENDLINYLQCLKYNEKYNDAQSVLQQIEKKKAGNLKQNLAKKLFFMFAPKCWLSVLFPDLKKLFLPLKMHILNNVWGAQHPNAG